MYRRITIFALSLGLAACANPNLKPVEPEVAETPPADSGMPPNLLYKLLLGEVAGQRGDMDLAVENYLDAARVSRDPEVVKRAAQVALYAGNLDDAIRACELWVELEPESVEARVTLGRLYVRDDEAADAVAAFRWAIDRSASPHVELTQIARAIAREENRETVLAVVKQLAEAYPEVAEGWFALATVAMDVNELPTAQAAVDRVIALRPDWEPGWRLFAQAAIARGERELAVNRIREVSDRNPLNRELRLLYAQMLGSAGQREESKAVYLQLLESTPDDADVLYSLALLELNERRHELAREYFQRLAASPERKDAAYFYLGQIDERDDRPDEAIVNYQQVGRGEHLIEARIRIATIEALRGEVAKSRRFFAVMRERHEDQAIRLYLAESNMFREMERQEEAMAVLSDGLRDFPDDHDLLYSRALLAEQIDRLDILEQDLQRILSDDPDNATALNALGYTLADRTDRLDDAYQLIRRALELKPDDAAVIDSMGWVNYRMGRYDEALKHLQRAFDLSGDPEIAAHLGEVLWTMGNQEGARSVWAQARDRNPEHKVLLRVIHRFDP